MSALAILASLMGGAPQAPAQGLSRLIEVVDANTVDRHVNILVQFRCGVRYVTHSPNDLGSSMAVRMRLGPDCNAGSSVPSERPSISGNSDLLRSAQLEELAPGEVTVTLGWGQTLNYVLAPTTDGRGFRVRLLDAVPLLRGRMTVNSEAEALSGYAINLESSTEPVLKESLEAGSAFLKLPTYISTIELEGKTWYRLRAGPVARKKDADRVLQAAQQRYPRAWIGINDETPSSAGDSVDTTPAVSPTVPVDPPMPETERKKLLEGARSAMSKRAYPRAVELLTKLTRQPEFPDRARAQELLGLSRERGGQLAHAKAEYGEYLRRYPDGDAAERLRKRLRMLAGAGRRGRSGTRGGTGADDEGAWRVSGGASQMYRWERAQLNAPQVQFDRQSQNALYTDGDFIARRRGERFDFISRINAGYAKDLMTDGPGDQTRVSSAFIELNDRERGIASRLGRQSRNSGGLLGTFDGLYTSWQIRPKVAISSAFGFPVESTRDSPETRRRFLGVAADFGPFNDQWDVGAFAVAQQYSGETDRRAIGVEARYFVPGRTFVGLVDYDVAYQALNSVVLMGNMALPHRWTASFNLDHRRAPVLTTRNALVGQPVATLDELLGLFSSAEIARLAQDRTPLSEIFSMSLSRPLSERVQFTIDAFASRVADTPTSGGVAATPETPLEATLQAQLIVASLWRSSDLFVLSARYQNGEVQKISSLGLATRLPFGNAWRIGPRFRVDRRESTIAAATEMLYVPSVRVDFQRGATWVEFEGGAEFGRRDIPAESERSTRYYFSLGYRINF